MTAAKQALKLRYGISRTARLLLMCASALFVLGGTISVLGVAETVPAKAYGGVAVSVLAVGMYTLIVIFARVRGPPTVLRSGAGIEGLKKVKPATFRPARKSRALLMLAFTLFSIGCASAVLGFRFGMPYLWIPGYGSSMAGFLLYTGTAMFGPLTITPGALVVAFRKGSIPVLRKAILKRSTKTTRTDTTPTESSSSSSSGTSSHSSSVSESESPTSPIKSRTPQKKTVYRAPRQSSSKIPFTKAKKASVVFTKSSSKKSSSTKRSSKPAFRSKSSKLV